MGSLNKANLIRLTARRAKTAPFSGSAWRMRIAVGFILTTGNPQTIAPQRRS